MLAGVEYHVVSSHLHIGLGFEQFHLRGFRRNRYGPVVGYESDCNNVSY